VLSAASDIADRRQLAYVSHNLFIEPEPSAQGLALPLPLAPRS
jgi:hypothetical protein